jgi:HAD superfamily hydrolase (TIGR01490 family)
MNGAGFYDLDGTVYRWQLFSVWLLGMVRSGLMPRIILDRAQKQYWAYRKREAPFKEFVDVQVRSYQDDERLKGIRIEDAQFVAEDVIRRRGKEVHVFTRELLRASQELGYQQAMISGSPTEIVQAFAKSYGVSLYFGTEHPSEGRVYTGGKPKEWVEDKGEAVRILADRHNLDLSRSFAIGDTTSDIGMFKEVGYPVCFNPTVGLLSVARANRWPVVIERKDVRLFLRSNKKGELREVELEDILPGRLAENLQIKLVAVRRG